MNLPALSAEIVKRIRDSAGDSVINQETVVQNMIAEAMEKQAEPELRTFIPNPPSQEVQAIWDRFNRAIENIVRENNLHIEQLTEAQCTQAIIQAFQCGDFKRLVRVSDNAQQVIYAPWQESEMQQAKIKALREALIQCNRSDLASVREALEL